MAGRGRTRGRQDRPQQLLVEVLDLHLVRGPVPEPPQPAEKAHGAGVRLGPGSGRRPLGAQRDGRARLLGGHREAKRVFLMKKWLSQRPCSCHKTKQASSPACRPREISSEDTHDPREQRASAGGAGVGRGRRRLGLDPRGQRRNVSKDQKEG